jgi:transposase
MIALEIQLDINAYIKQELSCSEIARRTGLDRRTVQGYIDHPERINRPRRSAPRASKVDAYRDTIASLLDDDVDYQASTIYDKLKLSGYEGCYELVKRVVRSTKEELTRRAYIRFETEPARQAQVDFGEFMVAMPDGSVKKYYLFAMILGYSRMLYCELLERCEMVSFLEAHIRAFEFFGGVPYEILYDRMKNVFIRRVAGPYGPVPGKTYFTQSLVNMAVHYGFSPQVAPAYAPWVKGKIERPMDFVREGWWRRYNFSDLGVANRDLTSWLNEKAQRKHGTTHERIDVRFAREKPRLLSLPPQPCDISERLSRTVNKDCTISVNCNQYVVEHTLVCKKVVVKLRHDQLRVFDDDRLVIAYTVPEGTGNFVADPRFYAALKADRANSERKFANSNRQRQNGLVNGRRQKGRAIKQTVSPSKPPNPIDVTSFEAKNDIAPILVNDTHPVEVQRRSLADYAQLGGEVRYAG